MAIYPRQRKDGTIAYQVKLKDRNGNWQTETFDDYTAAMEANRGGLMASRIAGPSRDAKETSVSGYWEVWAQANRTKVSEGWKISQDQMWRDYIEPVIGNIKVAKVDIPAIGDVIRRLQKLGRSPQTIKHVYSLMHSMFEDAVYYYEMIPKNPVVAKHHRPKVPQAKRDFLPPSQAWQLLDTAEKHEYMGPPVWLQTLAGLRPEATIALTWDCIDSQNDQILIKQAWKAKVGKVEPYPKGKDWEYVPMPPVLKDFLEHQRQRAKDPLWVCVGPRGGMLPYETYLRALARLCQSAKVPVITPHELRHSCTELWVSAGASQEDLRRLLNHKSLSATKNYIHRTDDRLAHIGTTIGKPTLAVSDGKQKSFPKVSQEADCRRKEGFQNVH